MPRLLEVMRLFAWIALCFIAFGCSRSSETDDKNKVARASPKSEFQSAVELLDGAEKDDALAKLRAASERGNADADLVLAFLADKSDFAQILHSLQAASARGNPMAEAMLGQEYLSEQGMNMFFPKSLVPQNIPEGLRLLKSSAEKGCALGAHSLGSYYRDQDPESSQKWYEMAAIRTDYFAKDFDVFKAHNHTEPNGSLKAKKPGESVLYALLSNKVKISEADGPTSKIVASFRKMLRTSVINSQKALASIEADKGNYRDAMQWYELVESVTEERTGLPIDAFKFLSEYDANELRSDSAFKGRKVAITGFVTAIGKDVTGSPYVLLNAGNGMIGRQVQGILQPVALERASSLNPGHKITLLGRVRGKTLGNVLLVECTIQ